MIFYSILDQRRNSKSKKMFRGKIRMHTCRIILFTSLVWFLLDVGVLFYYSDSSSSTSHRNSRSDGDLGPVPHDPLILPGVQGAGAHPAKRDTEDNAIDHFDSAHGKDDVRKWFNKYFLYIMYN